jgi:hypothetical protein
MPLTVIDVSSSITHPPAESILGQMTSKPENSMARRSYNELAT